MIISLLSDPSSQIRQILNSLYEGDGFSTETLGKAYFTIKLTGRAMVWPASFDTWKSPFAVF